MTLMISRYSNVYDVRVSDYNDSIDRKMHKMIKQYV